MDDSDVLFELLERTAKRTSVGPPPMAAMLAHASRVRRRRAALTSTAVLIAVVASVGGFWLLYTVANPEGDRAQVAASPLPPRSTSAAPTNDTNLDGEWIVRALVGTDGQSVLPASAGERLRMTFAHGAMTGNTGCNSVFGSYEQSRAQGQDLRFPSDKLGTTLVACKDEAPLISRLLDVRHVSGSADARLLYAENWMIIAELRRAP